MIKCKYFPIKYAAEEVDFSLASIGTFVRYFEQGEGLYAIVIDSEGKHIQTYFNLVKLEGYTVEDSLNRFTEELYNLLDDYVARNLQDQFKRDIQSIISNYYGNK